MSEEELIERLSVGSEQALGSAYDNYARQLLSYAFSYTKSKEDSEEIVQDAFLSLAVTINRDVGLHNLVTLEQEWVNDGKVLIEFADGVSDTVKQR